MTIVSLNFFTKMQTEWEEGRKVRFFCPVREIPARPPESGVSLQSVFHSSIAMEKAGSAPNYAPDTHCAFCGHALRGKKDRRRIEERQGIKYISGQVSLLGDTIFMEPKFACQKCPGRNLGKLTVLNVLATRCYTSHSPSLYNILKVNLVSMFWCCSALLAKAVR